MNFERLVEALKERHGADAIAASTFRDNRRIHVDPSRLFAVLEQLKVNCGFDMLMELSAADYLYYPNAKDRFGVVYCLLSTASGERVMVKSWVNDPDPRLPSAYPLWKSADWLEREVYDMYGIVFEGHPDLRRLLLPEEFVSFPLRKDYPLRGRGERHNFPVITRAES